MSGSRRLLRWGGVIIAMALIMSACGGTDEAIDVPPQDPDLVDLGESLYQSNCAACHGADLRGSDQGPSHLSRVYEPGHHGDAAFLLAVRNGSQQHHWNFGPMPPIDGLSDEDVAAIVAYVRGAQREQGFEPYPP